MTTSSGLVAVVERVRTECATEALRAERVYDNSRQIAPFDDDRIALPIEAPPTETPVDAIREFELPRRERGLEDLLESRGFTDAEIERAPRSWAVLGSVILVEFGDCERRGAVGDALLELHGAAETVLARGGIDGVTRDPDVEVVAGVGGTETVHVEHGTEYALDLAEVMFSPGNKTERVRMGEIVDAGERVLDMFAGVGYFALPMARAGADVTAVEIDPRSYRLLVENTERNGVTDRIDAVLGDCRDVTAAADRVVMGYYDAHEYLDAGLAALEPGGTVHLHEATPEPLFPDRPIERLESAAEHPIELLGSRVVKSHSEGVVHGVVDARLSG